MTQEELEPLLAKMWIVTHGIASMICSKSIKEYKVEDFITMLAEMGEQLIFSILIKNGNINKYREEFQKRGYKRIGHKFNWNIWI